MSEQLSIRDWGSVLVCLALLVTYLLLVDYLRKETLLAIGLYLLVLTVYLGWSWYVVEYHPEYRHVFSPRLFAVVLFLCTVAVGLVGWIPISLIAFIHLGALILIFSYWFVTVAALYHKLTPSERFDAVTEFPTITVIVPAYNEEGYISRTIVSLVAADYPEGKKQIVVVDDGSTDTTYEEARQYESESITVVSKENGGKYSALNYGLLFSDTEIVVMVDADSIVESTALLDIVSPLVADSNVGAVASNVKIFNRDSLVTKCQTLEYIFGINIYRRVFDHFASVSVVPGCLGAYRRTALDEVNGYDPHTLTEDFDTTMKVLKQGYKVRFSEAVVYTEAPDTWRDLYNQRLRWYRGNIMTLKKHFFDTVSPENHYLRRVHLPLALVTMVFVPLASWVILGLIVYIAITSGIAELFFVFIIFLSIIVLSNLIAIRIEGESPWYVLYAPLFVIGYKHFHDLVMVKSIIDVLRGTDMGWTNASRIDQRDATSTELSTETLSERAKE